jgi:hypothetical protein
MQHLYALEQQLPDISAWIGPHLVWALAGVVVVLLATPLFRRFRGLQG